MFYIVRFNSAFAALGINPTLLPADMRELGQRQGKAAGCTPQEAALIVLGELPLDFKMMANPATAAKWVKSGKVRLGNPAMQTALFRIGWEL
jgi:hypothetical protein